MRTKALLLTAALGVAGIATSMAQVYSVNAVGYINLNIQTGFNLVANQLTSANMTIGALLPAPNPGTTVYRIINGSYASRAYDPDDLVWLPDGNLSVAPGQGVFVFNPGAPFTWTMVGDVPQGTLTTPIPSGFSIAASQVPQAGLVSALGFNNPAPGDTIYKYTNDGMGGGSYSQAAYDPDDLVWLPAEPTLAVGESVFFFNPGTAKDWVRTFNVN